MRPSALLLLLAGNATYAAPTLHKSRPDTPESHATDAELLGVLGEHASWGHIRRSVTQTRERGLAKRTPQSSGWVAVLGSVNNALVSYGRHRPESSVEDVQTKPSSRFDGAVYTKVRYGPYRIPPISERNVESDMLGVSGMTNTIEINPRKPCKGDCVLLTMQAGLESADGTEVAKSVQGAMLHHTVVINRGPQVWDATCGKKSEHIFESGSEQSVIPFYLPESGIKAGYHLRKDDKFAINTELMNMQDEEKWVWLTLKFDVLHGSQPEFKESKVVWVSVGPDRCTGSYDNPFGVTNLTRTQQPLKQQFEEYSSPWTSPRRGYLVGSNSHLHNGGLNTELYVQGKNVCTSTAKYTTAGAGGTSGGHSHAKRQMGPASRAPDEQLTGQEQCPFNKPVPIAKGQSMYIRTEYDFDVHPGMLNSKGELDEVMAIAGVLMVFDHEEANTTTLMPPAHRYVQRRDSWWRRTIPYIPAPS